MTNLPPEFQPEDQGIDASASGPDAWNNVSFNNLFRSHDQLALEYLENRCKQAGGQMLETLELEVIVRNLARDLPQQSEFQLHEADTQPALLQRYGNCVLFKLARGFVQEGLFIDQRRLLDFALIGGYLKHSEQPRVHLGVRFKNVFDKFVTPFDLDQEFSTPGFQGFELEVNLEQPHEPYQRAFYWMSKEAFVEQMRAFDHRRGLLYGFALREYQKVLEKQGQYAGYLSAPEIRRVFEERNPSTQELRIQTLLGEAPDQVVLTLSHNAFSWSIGYSTRHIES